MKVERLVDWQIRYSMRYFRVNQAMVMLLTLFVVLFGIVFLVSSGPDVRALPILGVWWGLAGFGLYRWTYRTALRLSATPQILEWETAFRRGQVPIASVRRIRSAALGSNLVVIEFQDRAAIYVMATRGLREFCDALQDWSPSLPIQFGWMTRCYLAWPNALAGTAFKRRTQA